MTQFTDMGARMVSFEALLDDAAACPFILNDAPSVMLCRWQQLGRPSQQVLRKKEWSDRQRCINVWSQYYDDLLARLYIHADETVTYADFVVFCYESTVPVVGLNYASGGRVLVNCTA